MSIPLVTIRCITYNHEDYIRECLEGFIMQQTDFPFEAVVHDDASTDGTAEIIREYAEKYPDIIKPVFETENQYSKHDGSLGRIMNQHMRGKYIAFCEGDDYWTDPHKLQKQVDFLESHPDCAMCYTKVKCYDSLRGDVNQSPVFPDVLDSELDKLIEYNPVPTLTVLIRKDRYFEYYEEIKPYKRDWVLGDYPIWLWCTVKYKICGLDKVTAVYRILQESASHSSDAEKIIRFKRSFYGIRRLFVKQYNLPYNSNLLSAKVYYDIFLYCLKKGKIGLLFNQIGLFIKNDLFICFDAEIWRFIWKRLTKSENESKNN